jgi:hypothetical protein
MSLSSVEKEIVYKLHRRKIIGGVHKSEEDITRLFKKDQRGKVKKKIRNLVKKALLVEKPTSYGMRYSLNRDKLKEIEEIINEYLEEIG